jgi:hypothetical protein
MATQIIMDLNGDTRHDFDAMDAKALLKGRAPLCGIDGGWFHCSNP